eukprot:scaffold4.g4639.t1
MGDGPAWTEDVVRLVRRETAGLAGVAPPLCHFNNAGCSLPPRLVMDAVVNYLKLETAVGGYEACDEAAAALERPYTALASLLNCDANEIAIVSSATAAWQQVVYGLAWQWRPGDRLLTSVAEYGSNYIAYLQLAKRTGVRIQVVPETPEQDIDVEALERLVLEEGEDRKPALISITHVPTSSGRVYDAEAVGRVARRHGVLYMLDACQSVGQLPVDVRRIGCHFLSGTGRKYLRGPRGCGFLYCSREALGRFEPAAVDNVGARWVAADAYELQPTARRFEGYEMNFAAKAGLGTAVEYCLMLGAERIWGRVAALAARLRAALAAAPGVTVLDRGRVLCGLVSFSVEGRGAEEVKRELRQRRMNVSVSQASSTRLDFEARRLQEVVRASVHYYNAEQEVDALAAAVAAVAIAGAPAAV